MKKLANKYIIAVVLASLGLSSCVKKFDASSYAPPLTINGYTSASQIAPTNLVAHWTFNGTLTDSISNTTGVATGTSFSGGLEGQALQGALNSYVISALPPAVQSLHSFTVSTWVNMPENTTGAVGLVSIVNSQTFWSNLDIFFNNGATATVGQLEVHIFNNGASATGTDVFIGSVAVNNPFGGWVNVTLTYDDTKSTFVLYYNGGSIATDVVTGFAPLNWSGATQMIFGTLPFMANPSLTSGATAQGWATYLTGQLDETRIYNVALTSIEVNSLVGLQRRGK